MPVQILEGDCRAVLATLPDGSVHCIVSSPPYFGLRDYGTGTWDGGDPACKHVVGEMRRGLGLADSVISVRGGGHKAAEVEDIKAKDVCPHCGAKRVDSQIGLEQTPAAYVEQIVAVMREARRVLADDGILWLNLGDSYATTGGKKATPHLGKHFTGRARGEQVISRNKRMPRGEGNRWGGGDVQPVGDLKPKDLIGIPWRVAFALQTDGWYLRQDIIWAKPNPMPESVQDRCTKAHEYIFLLSKSERYFFDATAIAEDAVYADSGRSSAGPDDLAPDRKRNDRTVGASFRAITQKRNKRSVWNVATRPFKDAHFATFPPALIEPCILAGTSERGHCPTCGARWERVMEIRAEPNDSQNRGKMGALDETGDHHGQNGRRGVTGSSFSNDKASRPGRPETVGWKAVCDCGAAPVPDVVMDPFGGAGTTGLVADRFQRDALLIELNPEYAALARKRLAEDASLFSEVT